MSQTLFQPSIPENLQCDHLPSPIVQKENEQTLHTPHEISQVSTQPEEPSLPVLPAQEPLDARITIPNSMPSISRGHQNRKLVVQASFLRRVCAVLVSFTLWTVFTSNVIGTEKMLETLSIIIFCCFGYFAFENLYVCVTVKEDSHEHLFNILDTLFVMYFLCVVNFPKEESLTRYILISSPCLFLVSLCLYLWKSHAKKREKIIIKLSFTIQASLIIAKVLGYISFSWMEVFIPWRICLLGHQAYGFYTFIESLGKMIKQRNYYGVHGLSLIKDCLSMSWYLLYYGLSSLALGILLDLCIQVEKGEEFASIGVFAEMAQYYCSFFFGYTVIFIKLMKMLNINMNANPELQVIRGKQEKRYSLQPQKKNKKISHFIKVSPTYFVKIDKEKSQEINSDRSEIEEALCYVCETNQPDIILMGCGHGGMCKDCLLASMKKNDKCLQCRSPVQSIYQIKKESEYGTGAVEAYEAFCVVH